MKTIRTPRGTFQLITGKEVAKYKNAGYGYHHEHNGYVVLTDGQNAVAATKEAYKQVYS